VNRCLADSSVLVAAFGTWHSHFGLARAGLDGVTGVPAHAAIETVSVLTRLPAPYRVAPGSAVSYLRRLGRPVLGLSADRVLPALAEFANAGVRGGACYDALIAVTARQHDAVLLTVDRRAATTYRALDVRFDLLG
jgi:predicted nucleic acid-binding protein